MVIDLNRGLDIAFTLSVEIARAFLFLAVDADDRTL